MSPSWADKLGGADWRAALAALGAQLRPPRECVHIELHAARVVATRQDRQQQVTLREEAAVEAPAAEGPAWRGAVDALEALLAKPGLRDARATITVSNHFLRYAVVPWREDIASEAERLALVRHTLARLYGAHAEAWEVRLALGRHGAAALAAAIEPDLLAALRAMAGSAGLRLESIEPLLVAGFNRACTGSVPASYWFVSVEAGRVCLARIQDGVWQGVRCQRLGADWEAELPVILARESLLDEGSREPLPVYVYAPAADGPGWVAGQWVAGGLRVPAATPPPAGRKTGARVAAEVRS